MQRICPRCKSVSSSRWATFVCWHLGWNGRCVLWVSRSHSLVILFYHRSVGSTVFPTPLVLAMFLLKNGINPKIIWWLFVVQSYMNDDDTQGKFKIGSIANLLSPEVFEWDNLINFTHQSNACAEKIFSETATRQSRLLGAPSNSRQPRWWEVLPWWIRCQEWEVMGSPKSWKQPSHSILPTGEGLCVENKGKYQKVNLQSKGWNIRTNLCGSLVEVDINQKFLVCGFILRLKKIPLDLLCAPKTYIESDLPQDISQGLTQKLAKAPHSFAVTFLRVGNWPGYGPGQASTRGSSNTGSFGGSPWKHKGGMGAPQLTKCWNFVRKFLGYFDMHVRSSTYQQLFFWLKSWWSWFHKCCGTLEVPKGVEAK